MTTTQQQTNTPSPFVQNAGQSAFNFAQNLATQPFSAPLQGTAGFTPLQNTGFSSIGNLATAPNANNPFYNQEANAFSALGSTPLPTIQPHSILGGNVSPTNTTIASYMDPNLQMELAPTLQAIQEQAGMAMTGAGGNGSQATAAGAFGDARQGVQNAMTDYQAMLAAGQATGQAYRNAYNNALNARQGDVSNVMSAQTANEQIAQQQLRNLVGSGNALQNLAGFQTGQGLNLAQAALAGGATQQSLTQQQLNAAYNQQLQNLLGPYQYQVPALNSTLSALTPTQPSTTSVQQPNNAGWNILGSVLGAGASGIGTGVGQGIGISSIAPLLLSDERLKLDMEPIGETADGLPIYSYRYVREIDPTGTPRIGLSAQDVEKVYPEAVIDLGGVKAIDYAKATAFARLLGSQFAGDYAEAA
jgi:hypothetical protein